MSTELTYDYFVQQSGIPADWQEIMRQARAEYARQGSDQEANTNACQRPMPADMNSQLWAYATSFIGSHCRCATEAELTRFCIRNGIRLAPYIRTLRAYRVAS